MTALSIQGRKRRIVKLRCRRFPFWVYHRFCRLKDCVDDVHCLRPKMHIHINGGKRSSSRDFLTLSAAVSTTLRTTSEHYIETLVRSPMPSRTSEKTPERTRERTMACHLANHDYRDCSRHPQQLAERTRLFFPDAAPVEDTSTSRDAVQ